MKPKIGQKRIDEQARLLMEGNPALTLKEARKEARICQKALADVEEVFATHPVLSQLLRSSEE